MKKLFLSLFALPLAMATLVGCDVKNTDYEIKLSNFIHDAYVDEVYDISEYITMEEGYTYSAKAYAYDVHSFKETELAVEDLKFTPLTTDNITIVVSAEGKNGSYQKTFSISVKEHGDPIEDLLNNGGYSSFADPGFTKSFNRNANYKRPTEGNKTSLKCAFKGNDGYQFGGTIISPNNFRCLDCWSTLDWENVIFKFWCYNDSDSDIEFGFRIKDDKNGIDIDMGHEVLDPGHVAAPHAWSEILLPLRPLGVNHPLCVTEDGTQNDSFNVKARYTGVDYTSSNLSQYEYTFYLDEIDVVPASNYPDVQTSSYLDGWEYMVRDTHWEKGTVTDDFSNICKESNQDSTSSKKITFENHDDQGKEPDFVLAPEMQFTSDLPDFTKGKFVFDIKYSSNITDRSINLKVVAHPKGSNDWIDSTIVINPSPINDGWYHAEIDLATSGLTYTEVIRLAFLFNGVSASNKSSAYVYIDNIFLVQD